MSLVSPVDRCFREAKDARNWLTNLSIGAERGTRVELTSVKNRMDDIIAQLDSLVQGVVLTDGVVSPPPPAMSPVGPSTRPSAVNPVLVPQNISSYTAMRSQVRVSELQKRKAETLATELRQAMDHLNRLHRKNEAAAQIAEKKRELLGDNFADNSRADFAAMDMLQKERESLQHLKRRFTNMEQESPEVLKALRDQGTRLNRSKLGVQSVMDSLGLSNTVMGQIVRRNRLDAYIVYGGILFLLFIMWKIWTRA
eukprot:gene4068-2917_t